RRHKNIEKNLKICENKCMAYQEASFEAIFFSEKGICVDQNYAAQQMFGYTIAEAVGKPGTDWIAPQSRDLIKKNIFSGYEKPYEAMAMRKDGTVFSAEIRGKMINYEDRKIRVTALIDISQRKHVENELQKSAEQFKRLFNAIPDGVFITCIGGKTPGQILDVNISAERQTGYNRSELLKMNILNDLATDTNTKETLKEREGELENKKSIRFIERKRRKDRSEYWADVLTIMIDFNNVNAALSVNRDITRQKEIEIALKEKEEKLRNILENSTNMFYAHTPDHILTYLSPQVKDLLGYFPEEAKIRWTELSSENPINEIGYAMTVKAIESGQAQPPFELEVLHKSGRKVFVEVREAPVVEKGVTISIVGALTDITERKKVEQELEKHGKHLEKLVKERTVELEEKNEKLEYFNKLFVGREFRIKELRDRVKELEEKISE
ncbi:MAG: PAS domain S-box protein, partial [Bacteroidales bacterium]|nr:PAS domain S-box protein [Bacteroidales bacterium]